MRGAPARPCIRLYNFASDRMSGQSGYGTLKGSGDRPPAPARRYLRGGAAILEATTLCSPRPPARVERRPIIKSAGISRAPLLLLQLEVRGADDARRAGDRRDLQASRPFSTPDERIAGRGRIASADRSLARIWTPPPVLQATVENWHVFRSCARCALDDGRFDDAIAGGDRSRARRRPRAGRS